MRYLICSAAIVLLAGAAVVGCTKPSENAVAPATADSIESTTVSFANTKCPIMGGKPNADLTAQYEGETIGFCCDGCPEKWAALTAEQQAEKFAIVHAHADHQGHDHVDHNHSAHADDSGE